jgi:SAM-dependent methyltransferase
MSAFPKPIDPDEAPYLGGVELLLGAGSSRDRRIVVNGRKTWTDLRTLDFNGCHKPDVIHDLNVTPWPFEDDTFEEVHAYEVLEHLGQQGDFRAFFATFAEVWRILKPGGYLAATCPSYRGMWAWGDPSHTRVITSGSLVFLDQEQYHLQVGKTAMSDFRFCWRGDFRPVYVNMAGENDGTGFAFILEAIKPARTFGLE